MYKGTVVAESLDNQTIVTELIAVKIEETNDENLSDRWHIYSVVVSMNSILDIQKHIMPKWYAHFWNDEDLLVVFKDMMFTCSRKDSNSTQKAINYGISVGIPKEQLDFIIT